MTEKRSDWLLVYAVLFIGFGLAMSADAPPHRDRAYFGSLLMGIVVGYCIAKLRR